MANEKRGPERQFDGRRVTVRLDANQTERLRVVAERRQLSVSDVLRELVDRAVVVDQRRGVRA